MRRLGILGSPQGIYVRELVSAAQNRARPIDVNVLAFSDLAVKLTSTSTKAPSLHITSRTTCEQPENIDLLTLDGLLVRTMPLGTLEQVIFRMDALQGVEAAGIPVLNPPRALELAIDKWLTLQRLSAVGIRVPATIACQQRDAAMEAFEQLGSDVVVKPLFGGEGRGLMRVSDKDLAWRVFGTLGQLGSVLYVQQFLDHFGYDIRVLKIGSRMLSVKRWAQPGNWRTNVSQGSRAESHPLTEAQLELAEQAAAATGGSFLGIDLLPARDGLTYLLEVNAVPGWRGTGQALKLNIAELVIDHLEHLHAQRS